MNKNPTANSLALDACLKEYEALRSEMDWLGRDGAQYQNFAFVLLGIVGAALFAFFGKDGASMTSNAWLILPTLLTASLLFSILAMLYVRQHDEIHVVAGYIAESLRPHVRTLCEDAGVWSWEEYKATKAPAGTVVWTIRMCTFLVPAAAAVVLAMLFVQRPGVVQGTATPWWIWAALDAVVIVICLSRVASGGPRLPPRTAAE